MVLRIAEIFGISLGICQFANHIIVTVLASIRRKFFHACNTAYQAVSFADVNPLCSVVSNSRFLAHNIVKNSVDVMDMSGGWRDDAAKIVQVSRPDELIEGERFALLSLCSKYLSLFFKNRNFVA